ncbi:MAG: hypothetical protein ACI9C4_001687 [Paraglaciecola sp.]|jgi:hypothetical protein
MGYFVGAYATSPAWSTWDPALEREYYQQLQTFDNIQGLEHPFVGTLHPHNEQWFLENIDPDWDFVLTCLPGIMNALGENPQFGIASNNEQGRAAALAFMHKACIAIGKLNHYCGRQAVKAIEIQTAPNQSVASSSAAALHSSVQSMLNWDWQGANIVIEHCDTLIPGQIPAKGFLSLADEIKVLTDLNQIHGKDMGIVINWGRSAIETRGTEGVIEHITQARNSGLLKGLIFSGVSDKDSPYGTWKDTHMPVLPKQKGEVGAEHSLLSESQIHQCLDAYGDLSADTIIGIKLGVRPKDAPLYQRLAYNRAALAMIEHYFAQSTRHVAPIV